MCGGFSGESCLLSVEYYKLRLKDLSNMFYRTFLEPKLKPLSLTWINVTPMLSPRSGVVTVVSQGRLWALGGFNGVDRLKSTEVRARMDHLDYPFSILTVNRGTMARI